MRHTYSMWFWAINTVAVALLCIAIPDSVASLLGASVPVPDSTRLIVRLLGLVMAGYGAAYGVAAVTRGRAYMRFSVVMRACILPAVVAMVIVGWMPAFMLALGVVDLVGALWTHAELRRMPLPHSSH